MLHNQIFNIYKLRRTEDYEVKSSAMADYKNRIDIIVKL